MVRLVPNSKGRRAATVLPGSMRVAPAVQHPVYAGAMASLTIATLGDLDASYELCGVCCACRLMRPLSLPTLLERLSAAFPIAQVRTRLRCSDCSGRQCEIRLVWVGNGPTG